jgi:hypothetical protein
MGEERIPLFLRGGKGCQAGRPAGPDRRPSFDFVINRNPRDPRAGDSCGAEGVRRSVVVNEMVTNALKHAFPGDRGGTIQVK